MNVLAVDDLTFDVRPGVVTGFLGPNGAGKSTTMRMMVGLDRPTSGSVRVNGRAPAAHAAPLHEVGALLEARAVHPGRSARNHLRALALTSGIGRSRVDQVLELVGLADVADKRVGAFSLGMGQRLGVAAALLGDPATLVLDEPVNGLDLDGIRWIRALLKALAAEGRTVFLSSHLMSEMAVTADHVIVVGKGRLLRDQPMADFIDEASRRDGAGACLQHRPAGAGSSRRPGATTALDAEVLTVAGAVQRRDRHPGGPGADHLLELSPQAASLEDAYLALTRDTLDYRTDDHDGPTSPRARRATRVQHERHRCTATLPSPTDAGPAGRVDGHVTLPRVIASEWLKFRTLRSTVLILVAAMLAMVAFGAIIAHNTRNPAGLDPEDLVASGPLQGYYLGQLLIGCAGRARGQRRVLLGHDPGDPGRRTTPAAGAGGQAASSSPWSSGIAMIAASVVGFLVAQAFLSGYRPTYSLSDPDVLRVVVGTGVYLTLVGLLGGAIGWIVRSTPGALVALFALILVLPVLLLLFHGAWGTHVGAWLPTGAGCQLLHEPADAGRARAVAGPRRDGGLGGRGLRARWRAAAPPRRLTHALARGWRRLDRPRSSQDVNRPRVGPSSLRRRSPQVVLMDIDDGVAPVT